MSLRIETTPNQYTDYDLYSATRFDRLGQQFLSLINPKYGTTEKKENPSKEPETAPVEENKPLPANRIEKASDLCRAPREQHRYYLADREVIQQIEENLLPNESIFPYTPSSNTSNDNDDQLTTSISDWQILKQSDDSNQHILSQIITIVQCRSTLNSSPFAAAASTSQRINRHAVRLFINAHQQQQQQMNTFLDIVNEALLLEPDTIKTLWDAKGDQVTNPADVLRRGRLYFASRDEAITVEELSISDDDFSSINRLETVRFQLAQPAHFIEKPAGSEQANIPSRKSTPFNPDERRSATVHAQAIAYNDPQTFPDIFLRHYLVGDILGDGRFSAVLECRDKATGIQLALKIIDKSRCQGYEYLIENELAILRRVKHPNIIKLVEEFQNESKYFLVFEYVSNGDLLTAISTMNKYSEHDVALMLSQIVSALKHLHSLQIVHRDVKLENILITNHPDRSVTLKLADFGLALCLTDTTPIVAAHGESLCGTPMYLAPEVIQNRNYRIENDMWSVGVIAFTLLSGMAPFDGDNEEEILSNVVNKAIDFTLLPKVTLDCRDAVMAMLERDPIRRISAAELLQHPWIKREMQRRMDPTGDRPSARRRKKGTTKQRPMLTFSSVEHPHPIQAASIGGLMTDIDEL